MSTRTRRVVWDEAGVKVQCDAWRAKLDEAKGNVTRAGKLLGIGARHAFRLTRYHGLNVYAAELRKKATGRTTGRPRSGTS